MHEDIGTDASTRGATEFHKNGIQKASPSICESCSIPRGQILLDSPIVHFSFHVVKRNATFELRWT